ncbi:thiamine biosynthesis protein [filamentous cyanobacterium CCP2]|nr:thiamine biosynthesis protein [filamentous cyanobacterium CCP2]
MLKFLIRRSVRFLALSLITFGLLVACNPQSSTTQTSNQPLAVGSSPWPGFAGHYVAVAQDFFSEEGITVTDNYFQVATDVNTALLAGRLDLALTGGPDMVVMASQDPSLRFIMLTDYSDGADGILARNVNSPEDLRGKNVAWENLPLQALLLQRYLESGGLTQADINLQIITAAEAATAFASQNIDVAITYEPWLTTAASQGQGQVIFSSKDTNIIPVGVVAKESVIADRREDILAFMRALDQGVAFVRDNPEEANPIVAEKLGVSPEEVPEQLSTVRLFDIEDNKTIGFNPDDPLNVMDSLEFAAETSEAIGLIASPVDAANLYDDSLVNAL